MPNGFYVDFLVVFHSFSDFLERSYARPIRSDSFLLQQNAQSTGIRVSAEMLLHFYRVAPVRLSKTIKTTERRREQKPKRK